MKIKIEVEIPEGRYCHRRGGDYCSFMKWDEMDNMYCSLAENKTEKQTLLKSVEFEIIKCEYCLGLFGEDGKDDI